MFITVMDSDTRSRIVPATTPEVLNTSTNNILWNWMWQAYDYLGNS